MGLLTPFYLAGLAALSLPLLLHLIRRTPRGRQAFSSLMFLSPSPPRLTRRSRLDHLLLLILRLTALALLALAFARPFLRLADALPLGDISRRVAILLDASASMRRGDLWRQAADQVEGALKGLGPQDDVALFTFDERLHAIVDFAQDASEPTAGKPDLIRQRLRSLKPSWGSTDLASAMTAVASEMEAVDDERRRASAPQLVLITDLARGSRTDALEAYKWPENVPVDVHVLAPKQPTNAAVQLLADDEQAAPGEPRVRVTNAADSISDQFFVGWAPTAKPTAANAPLATYVPAGQSRVIRLPRSTGESLADRIVLKGDEADFDNTYYVVPPRQQIVKAVWFGADAADDARSLRYFFDLAAADDPLRKVEMRAMQDGERWQWSETERPALIVATEAIPATAGNALTAYVRAGGMLLMVLKDQAAAESLQTLLDDVLVAKAATGDESPPPDANRRYRMLGEIDFSHPLFAAFANPRYSDFTKIHFWRHRPLALKASGETRVVARFDNGDPAILERTIGAGRVLALASGWQPEDSQLALSSKFVPLMQAVLEMACGGPAPTARLTVGQPLPLPARAASQAVEIEKPDGTRAALAADAKTFTGADRPGIYRLRRGGDEYAFAANIAAAESDTAPMDLDRLEQLGVRFADGLSRAQRAEQLRQQRDTELEGGQRLWRWLIAAAIALLILETWLAGRAARRQHAELAVG